MPPNKQILALTAFAGAKCVKGKGMTKENVEKGKTLASYMAYVSAAALAYITMEYLDLPGSSDETGLLLLHGLLYGCIFLAFHFLTSRLFKWLYS